MIRIAILALVGAAFVAAPQGPQPADKAAQVLASARKAIGGTKIDSLQTFSLKAEGARNLAQQQIKSEIELYLAMPDRYVMTEHMSGPITASNTVGFNGDKLIRSTGSAQGMNAPTGFAVGGGVAGGGGMRSAGVGRRGGASGGSPAPELTPEQQATMAATALRAQRVEASRYMLAWFATMHPSIKVSYAYAGEAESPDGKAHVIHVTADGGVDLKLFIDQATNLPLMVTWSRPERSRNADGTMSDPAPVEYRLFVGDWKDVDGIKFPHALQRARAGATTEEWVVKAAKVNPKIEDSKFKTN